MPIPASCAEAALEELCVAYGYCLPEDEIGKLLLDPPPTAEAFADAILVAEGLDPALADGRDQVIEVVRDWLFDADAGRGTQSALPRFA